MKDGPWLLYQTVYKYSAIIKDLMINIANSKNKNLKLSTAGGAVSAWSGKWWGGNLKGLLLLAKQHFAETIDFMTTGTNSGGISVMSYDLSDDPKYTECPSPGVCSLQQQVAFYMNTYQQAGIPAAVGYEVGAPAYPDPGIPGSAKYTLPLTTSALQEIVSQTQKKNKAQGGFFWEMYKEAGSSSNADPTAVAQAICKAVLGSGNERCQGEIPQP